MTFKIKSLIIFAISLTFIIPFFLQKTIFPFYRFGMFAEPVKNDIQKEKFEVLVVYQNNRKTFFEAEKNGLYESIFTYIKRNYYYRNESNILLEIISKQLPDENIKLYFLRYPQQNATADTISTFIK